MKLSTARSIFTLWLTVLTEIGSIQDKNSVKSLCEKNNNNKNGKINANLI